MEELEDRKKQQQQPQHNLAPDRAGRRNWLLGRDRAAAAAAAPQGAGARGAHEQEQQPGASAGGAAGGVASWPTMYELVHRNAHHHMKERVAELQARRREWEEATVLPAL